MAGTYSREKDWGFQYNQENPNPGLDAFDSDGCCVLGAFDRAIKVPHGCPATEARLPVHFKDLPSNGKY